MANPDIPVRGRAVPLALRRSVGLLALVAALAACSPGPSPEVPVGADGQADPVLVQGREIYSGKCARCHGADGFGATGPQLANGRASRLYPTTADQIDLVQTGRKSMPAFGAVFTHEELEAVVRYTREVL